MRVSGNVLVAGEGSAAAASVAASVAVADANDDHVGQIDEQ